MQVAVVSGKNVFEGKIIRAQMFVKKHHAHWDDAQAQKLADNEAAGGVPRKVLGVTESDADLAKKTADADARAKNAAARAGAEPPVSGEAQSAVPDSADAGLSTGSVAALPEELDAVAALPESGVIAWMDLVGGGAASYWPALAGLLFAGGGGGSAGAAAAGTKANDAVLVQPTMALNPSSDTGVPGDARTKDSQPAIKGRAGAGDKVVVTIDINGDGIADMTLTTTADSDGNWSDTPTAVLPDGPISATAISSNASGQTSSPVTISLVIDTTINAPAPTLASASNSGSVTDNITHVAAPRIEGKNATPGDAIHVSLDTNGDDITDITLDTVADASGQWFVNVPSALPDGLINVQVSASDAAGNISAGISFPLVIDTQISTLAARLASASDSGASGDTITRQTRPEIAGIGTPGDTITVTSPTGEVMTTTVASDGTWSVTAQVALPDGAQNFIAIATDLAGNTSAALNVPVTIDTMASSAPLAGLDTGSDSGIAGDGLTNDLTPTISGTGTPGDTIRIISPTDETLTTTVAADGTWSATPQTALPAGGPQDFRIVAIDGAGNVSDETRVQVTIDNTAPGALNVTLASDSDSAVNGDNITSVNTPVIQGSGEPGAHIQVTLPGTGEVLNTTVASNGTWQVSTALALADGAQAVQVRETDAAGNVSNAVLNLTIDTLAPGAPSGNLSAASDSGLIGDHLTSDATPAITGAGSPGDTITVTSPTGEVMTTVVAADGTWTVTPTAPLPYGGPQDFVVVATDVAGNSSAPGVVTVNIDTIAPSAPSGALDPASDSGVAGDNLTNNVLPTLSGNGTPGDTITVISPTGETLVTTVAANGTWSVTPSVPLPEGGPQNFSVTETDAAGNTSAALDIPVTVDTTAPTMSAHLDPASDTGVTGDLRTQLATPGISGTGNAGDTVTVLSPTGEIMTTTVQADGTWTVTPLTGLPQGGVQDFVAMATDAAGNTSTSQIVGITVDSVATAAPTVELASDLNNNTYLDADELGSAITVAVTIGLPAGAQAGDTIRLTDGTTVQDIIISATDIGNGHVLAMVDRPAEGATLTVTASLIDIAGNESASSSDAAQIDTTPAGNLLAEITTDGNNDAFLNEAELSSTPVAPYAVDLTTVSVSITLPSGAVAGDTLSVSDNAGNSRVFTLSAAQIADGVVITSFPTPVEDQDIVVSAFVTDIAGNLSPVASDLAHRDTFPPGAPLVSIDSDVNNDGYLNALEMGSSTTINVTITLPTDPVYTASVGDTLSVIDNFGHSFTKVLDAGDLSNGFVSLTMPRPAEGSTVQVSAQLTDVASNSSPSAWDIAKLDTLSLAAPTVVVLEDGNNNGFISSSELSGSVNVQVTLPVGVGAGDTVLISDNAGNTRTITLTAADVSAGLVLSSFPAPAEGSTFSLTASVTDAAGNPGAVSATDSAIVDTTAPVPLLADLAVASDSGVAGDHLTHFTTPVITGTGTAGDTITVTSPTGEVLITVVAANGTWSVTPTVALAEGGPQNFSIVATDPAGNSSPASNLPITVDTVAPAASGALSAIAPNDSGTLGDNITRDTTPTLSGATQAGSAVSVVVNGVTYTTTADGSGNWSITTSALADGVYTPVITTTDPAGNSTTANGTAFTIDSTLPAVSGALQAVAPNDSGAIGDNITKDTTPALTGTTQAGSAVSVVVSGVAYTTTADASGNWSITTAVLADGSYTPVITITDTAGNLATGNGTAFVIDSSAPGVNGALQAVAPNDSGALGDNITRDNTPALIGNTQPGSSVSVVVNGATYTATADASGNWSITAASLADGSYTPVITITDLAGNSATANGTAFTIDTSTPSANGALQAVAPNDSGALGDNITSDNTPTLTGTTQAGSAVSVVVNGATYTTTADASGNWSITTAALADGSYTPVITTTDPAGNSTTASGAAFSIDATAPLASGALQAIAPNDSGALGDNITKDTTPTLSGTTQAGSAVSVVINGATYTTTADASGNWSITTSSLSDGSYTPVITVTDIAGNSTTANGTAFTIDATNPSVNGSLQAIAPNDSGILGDNITKDNTPTLTGSTQAGSAVSVVINGSTYTTTADASGNWSITAATLADGSYTPVITVTDPAGNISSGNGTPFTIDTATPSATGALQAIAPNDSGTLGDNVTNDNTPTISGTTQAGSAVSVVVNGATYTTTADASGNWSITTAALADGSYTPVITTTDLAGNSATGNGTALTIDTAAPAASGALQAIAPNDSGTLGDNITSDTTPTLTGSTQPGAAVSVVVNGNTYSTTASASGQWAITTTALSDGSYTPVITVTDIAGNSSTANGTAFTVDTALPTVSGALQAVAPNDTGLVGDNLTSDNTPTLTGSTQAGSAVSVVINGSTYTTTADASGNWSITASSLSDGTYTPAITITDPAGNVASGNGSAFTVDTTTPAINGSLQAVAPNDSGLVGDNLTKDNTPTITGNTQAGSSVSVVINGATYTTTADASGNWSITTTSLSDASYTPVITITDPAGNTATGNGTPCASTPRPPS